MLLTAVQICKEELAEVHRKRAAISAVLRAITNSPHDLQPIFDTILDNAVHLCRAAWGGFRLIEEAGFRLVAFKPDPVASAWVPPMLLEHGSYIGRLFGSKSPIHIPDLGTHLELNSAVAEEDREAISRGVRTLLIVPMLRNDELIGMLSLARQRVEPFTENEIELITDFAAETGIALEITRRERELRELQMELAHANRVATMGHLTASITHQLRQPMTAAGISASATLRWLERTPPDLANARESLAEIVGATDRASKVVDSIGAFMRKASPRKERLDLNESILGVVALTRSEAIKHGVVMRTELAPRLPGIHGDRVQLQQVMLNLIVNAIQAMSGVAEERRDLLISSAATEEGARVEVRDTGSGLQAETLPHLFDPFYTTKPDSMGMGLSICRSIVEAHEGRLWATPCEPHGSLFQFTIPAAHAAAS